jgi:molybdate transport system substrate-binding protein
MTRARTAITAVVLGAILAAPAAAETLRVSAAASLTEAFTEIARDFERARPGVTVELNFAGSQVLRTQIEQGAPVDVFASADRASLEPLERAGLVGRPVVFAHNRLVIVVPAAEARVARLGDLARPGTKVVVASPAVPAGRYTAQLLSHLGAARLYGDDFAARVEANVASRETSVRAVLAKVALGEADAGVVYATDAAASAKVRVIDVPARYNVVAEYPIAVVTRGPAGDIARAFVDRVRGVDGQAILRRHGFAP